MTITIENAQSIADAVSKRTFELLNGTDEAAFKLAERKALLDLGYQPAVYTRKMQAIWNGSPWAFRAFMDMDEEDFS